MNTTRTFKQAQKSFHLPPDLISCSKTSEETKFMAFDPSEKDSNMNLEFRKSNFPSLPPDFVLDISLNGPKENVGEMTSVTLERISLMCMLVHTWSIAEG